MVPPDDRSALFPPPLHPREEERLSAVQEATSLFWPTDEQEDRPMKSIARQAADACQTSMAMVSLMDETEQRFLACVGRGRESTERENTFCAYCILQPEPLVVEDATNDARFQENPYVKGAPFVRFYIGAPILDDGLPLGTVCVVDTRPREASSQCLLTLEKLAEKAAAVLRLRKFLTDRQGPFASSAKVRASVEQLNELLLPLVQR